MNGLFLTLLLWRVCGTPSHIEKEKVLGHDPVLWLELSVNGPQPRPRHILCQQQSFSFFSFFALSRRNDPCLCLSLMTFCDALSWHFHFNKLWIFHHVMQSPLHKFKDAETPESFTISLMFITCCCSNNLLNLFLQINSSYIFEKVYLIHEAFMAHLV